MQLEIEITEQRLDRSRIIGVDTPVLHEPTLILQAAIGDQLYLIDVDAYIHAGGQWEWDSAAPAGVLWAAGMHASRLGGAPLVYNRRDPYLPDLLMCRPELAPLLLEEIRAAHRR